MFVLCLLFFVFGSARVLWFDCLFVCLFVWMVDWAAFSCLLLVCLKGVFMFACLLFVFFVYLESVRVLFV